MEQIGKISDSIIGGIWERDKSHLGILDLAGLGLESDRWLSRMAKDEIRERFEKFDDHQLWPYLKKSKWPVLQQVATGILISRSHSYLVRGILIVKDMIGDMIDEKFPVNIIMEARGHVHAAEKALKWAEGVNKTRHKRAVKIEVLRLQAKKHPGKAPQPPKPQQLKLL